MKSAGAFLLGWVSAVSTAVALMLLRDLLRCRRAERPPASRREIRADRAARRLAVPHPLPTLYVRDTQPADED